MLERKLGLEADQPRPAPEALLLIATARPTGPAAVEAVTGDPDDDLTLACAAGAEVDVIATGDRKHLLPVEEHRGVRILTPPGAAGRAPLPILELTPNHPPPVR